jgi:hypothetical protein
MISLMAFDVERLSQSFNHPVFLCTRVMKDIGGGEDKIFAINLAIDLEGQFHAPIRPPTPRNARSIIQNRHQRAC